VLETSRLAHRQGLKNVLVTNGFVNEKPLRDLLPSIDAMNVDIKSMEGSFYRSVCSAGLDPVLRTVRIAHESGCHVEITNLVIPGLNDRDEHFDQLSGWIAGLSPDIPLHFSRYFPRYRMNTESTPVETLERARALAMEKLRFVFVGNITHESWGDTLCPKCGHTVIKRNGYTVNLDNFKSGHCGSCGAVLPIVC